MSETTRRKNVVETVVTDADVARVSEVSGAAASMKLSKVIMKAFRRAKKASDAENARARDIVSAQRAKREGVIDVEPDIPNDNHPSMSGQASLFDY